MTNESKFLNNSQKVGTIVFLLILCFSFQAIRTIVRSLKPGGFSLLISCISSTPKTTKNDKTTPKSPNIPNAL